MNPANRDEPAIVYANLCVHDDIEITLDYCAKGGDSARIHFGRSQEMVLEFIDAESMTRLATAAIEGAAELRRRIEASNRELAAVSAAAADGADRADRLLGVAAQPG
jgi:hypothetical protein